MTTLLKSLRQCTQIAISKRNRFASLTRARFREIMIYDDAQAWKDVSEHFPRMTIYSVFLLKKGLTWSPDETPEIEALQGAHLAKIRRLGVLKTSSLAEVQELLRTDPMVSVGRLSFEVHSWMVGNKILP